MSLFKENYVKGENERFLRMVTLDDTTRVFFFTICKIENGLEPALQSDGANELMVKLDI